MNVIIFRNWELWLAIVCIWASPWKHTHRDPIFFGYSLEATLFNLVVLVLHVLAGCLVYIAPLLFACSRFLTRAGCLILQWSCVVCIGLAMVYWDSSWRVELRDVRWNTSNPIFLYIVFSSVIAFLFNANSYSLSGDCKWEAPCCACQVHEIQGRLHGFLWSTYQGIHRLCCQTCSP